MFKRTASSKAPPKNFSGGKTFFGRKSKDAGALSSVSSSSDKVFSRDATPRSTAAFEAMVEVVRRRRERAGLFRVSGDMEAVAEAAERLDAGDDANEVLSSLGDRVGSGEGLADATAALLKKWTRHRNLMTASVRENIILKADDDPTTCVDPDSDFWVLLNLLADVADKKDVNKMDAYNLAVVFAPNLSDDAIYGVEQFVDTLAKLIEAVRLKKKGQTLAEEDDLETAENAEEEQVHDEQYEEEQREFQRRQQQYEQELEAYEQQKQQYEREQREYEQQQQQQPPPVPPREEEQPQEAPPAAENYYQQQQDYYPEDQSNQQQQYEGQYYQQEQPAQAEYFQLQPEQQPYDPNAPSQAAVANSSREELEYRVQTLEYEKATLLQRTQALEYQVQTLEYEKANLLRQLAEVGSTTGDATTAAY